MRINGVLASLILGRVLAGCDKVRLVPECLRLRMAHLGKVFESGYFCVDAKLRELELLYNETADVRFGVVVQKKHVCCRFRGV